MKKLYFLIFLFTIGLGAIAQKTWNGGSGQWNLPGNWSPSGVPGNNESIIFNNGNTITVTNVPTTSINDLTISGNTQVTFQSTSSAVITVNNAGGSDINVAAGSSLNLGTGVDISMASGTSVTMNGQFTIAANRKFVNTGTISLGSSSLVEVSGTFENKGVISNASASKLKFLSGSTYLHNLNGSTVPTASWQANSTCRIAGVTSSAPSGLGQAFGNFAWDCANQSQTESLAASGMSVAGTLSVTNTGSGRLLMDQETLSVGHFELSGGTFQIADGFTFFLEVGTPRTLNVSGNLSLSGGTLLMSTHGTIFQVGDGTINLGGDFVHSGGTITESGGARGVINFTGTSVQSFSKSGTATIANDIDFAINNNAAVDFASYVLNGSTGTFTLNDGGKIITSNAAGLSSNGATGSIQVTGTRSYSNAADYEFRGASTGNFSTSGDRVRDLIINNTAGQVATARDFLVDRTLVLTNGYVTPAGSDLTVNTNGVATTTNGAFVNGQLGKITAGTTAFTFPVGKVDGGLRTIGIKPSSGANSRFVAEFFRGGVPTGTLGTGLTGVSKCEYWNLSRPSGTAAATVTLSWAAGSGCNAQPYVTDPTTLRVAHLSGGVWNDEGRISSTGDNTSGTITSGNAVSTFSPFALASSSASENPLPVVFGNVKAYEKNNGVQIEWSNLTEKDVARYVIERSSNGSDFAAIGQQLPTSNQDDRADYTAFDASPLAGTNYYRIKAEETTGKIVYSKVLSVSLGLATQSLKLYPNPVKGHQVSISLSVTRGGQYDLRVVNMTGQDVLRQRISSQGTISQTIDLPATVTPGVYNMVITGADYRETKTFIVQ